MYRVDWASKRVERQLERLPQDAQERVLKAIAALADNPRPFGVQKLEDDLYRIRIGRYRVVYWVSDEERLVVITKVAKRSEHTYRRLR
ncbi:MAG: type II toxin-antitoxin system RelE/ParE family toxin [Anaerolineae bacterium]|nr:type II toxin-antitoxin system RelE/ParE family toxin [Anaerolineae bacterium]